MSAAGRRYPDVLLERYLAGDLSAERRAEIDAARITSPDLQARLDALDADRQTLLAQDPPALFAARVMATLERDLPASKPFWRRGWWLFAAPSLGAAAALFFAVVVADQQGSETTASRLLDESNAPAAPAGQTVAPTTPEPAPLPPAAAAPPEAPQAGLADQPESADLDDARLRLAQPAQKKPKMASKSELAEEWAAEPQAKPAPARDKAPGKPTPADPARSAPRPDDGARYGAAGSASSGKKGDLGSLGGDASAEGYGRGSGSGAGPSPVVTVPAPSSTPPSTWASPPPPPATPRAEPSAPSAGEASVAQSATRPPAERRGAVSEAEAAGAMAEDEASPLAKSKDAREAQGAREAKNAKSQAGAEGLVDVRVKSLVVEDGGGRRLKSGDEVAPGASLRLRLVLSGRGYVAVIAARQGQVVLSEARFAAEPLAEGSALAFSMSAPTGNAARLYVLVSPTPMALSPPQLSQAVLKSLPARLPVDVRQQTFDLRLVAPLQAAPASSAPASADSPTSLPQKR